MHLDLRLLLYDLLHVPLRPLFLRSVAAHVSNGMAVTCVRVPGTQKASVENHETEREPN